MTWQDAVTVSLKAYATRHGTVMIPRLDFVREEIDAIVAVANVKPSARTPEQTITTILKRLAGKRVVRFVDKRGTYELLIDHDEHISVDSVKLG